MRPAFTRAVWLASPRSPITVGPFELRDPGPGELLVRMEACGVCHSDLFVAGLEKLPLAPLVLGHEGIGRVVETGEGAARFRAGDRVGITFLASTCGECNLCQAHKERFCGRQRNTGYSCHGVMAGYSIVGEQHLVAIPAGLAAAEAAPLCCAGWTAYGALREAAVPMGGTVAIFGLGGVGHLAVQYARHAGLRVAAADVSEEKLEYARHLGAGITVHAGQAGRRLSREYGGMDAALVLTADPAAIEQAFRSLKRAGTLVLAGLSSSQFELPLVDTVLKGINVRGSYLGTREDLNAVLQLGAQGAVRPMITEYELEDAPGLFERLRRGELRGRAVIRFTA